MFRFYSFVSRLRTAEISVNVVFLVQLQTTGKSVIVDLGRLIVDDGNFRPLQFCGSVDNDESSSRCSEQVKWLTVVTEKATRNSVEVRITVIETGPIITFFFYLHYVSKNFQRYLSVAMETNWFYLQWPRRSNLILYSLPFVRSKRILFYLSLFS